MFDLGFWELLLIGLIALVVIGPERLPGMAVTTGQWVGRLRRYARHMRSQINEELESEHLKDLLSKQHREIDELRREVGSVRDSAEQTFRDVGSQVRGSDDRPSADTDTAQDKAGDTATAATEADAAPTGDTAGTETEAPAASADTTDDDAGDTRDDRRTSGHDA